MLLRLFKSNRPYILILIPLTGAILWSKTLIFPPSEFFFDTHHTPLYEWTTGWFVNNSIAAILISYLFIVIQAFFVNRLNTVFILVEGRSYLPALFYILLCSSFADLQRMHPALIANFFLLAGIYLIFNCYKKEKAFDNVFDSSFLIATGSLFYFGLVYFMLLIWFGIFFLKPFTIRELIISIIGLIIPYILLFSYFFFTDQLFDMINRLTANFVFVDLWARLNIWYYIFMSFVFILVIFILFNLLSGFTIKKISTRKYFGFLLWMFVVSIAGMLISYITSLEMLIFIAIPVSYFLAYQFIQMRSRFWGEFLFIILFVAVFVVRLMN